MTQHCRHCNKDKEPTDFYPYAPRKCKSCFYEMRRIWERNHPEQIRAKVRRRWLNRQGEMTAKNRNDYIKRKLNPNWRPKDYGAAIKDWIAKHPVEMQAKVVVEKAVKRGDLVRPSACSYCGHVGRIVAHHRNYSRPLDVNWVCTSCHRLIHSQLPYPIQKTIPAKSS